jgi:hypothetical protein
MIFTRLTLFPEAERDEILLGLLELRTRRPEVVGSHKAARLVAGGTKASTT